MVWMNIKKKIILDVDVVEGNTKSRLKEASSCRQSIHLKQAAGQSSRKKLHSSMQCVHEGSNRANPVCKGHISC
jgi:hypothetical protein